MDGNVLLLGTTGLLAALGTIEAQAHRRRLASLPLRVHVNGTRGKSSVTRLIAAGLRASGRRTFAKTTGTLARMILPDGREYPIDRPRGANVIEQIRVIERATQCAAEALVIECMALQPHLQWLCEAKLVRATHAVITNVRADHLEVMGPTEEDVGWALAGMIPKRGKLFTAERRHLGLLRRAAASRRALITPVGPNDVAAVTHNEMQSFAYVEHPENVALALAVCDDLGIDRQMALEGMWSAQPDPGALTVHELDFFGHHVTFVNGFAANDPESTEHIWNLARDRYPFVERRLLVVNCRGDRAERSEQLGSACAAWEAADHYVLMGSGTAVFARAAAAAGIEECQLVALEDQRVEEIFETIIELVGHSTLVVGIGNIGGQGMDLARYFRNRSTSVGVTV